MYNEYDISSFTIVYKSSISVDDDYDIDEENTFMFVKLNEILQNSKNYQKEYKLLYMPQPTELNYSVDVANLLAKSRGFGVNPQVDKPLGVGDTSVEH